MDEMTLEAHARLLRDVIDIYDVLVHPRVGPAPGSPAADELQAARQELGQAAVWGEEPVRTAYTHAVMNYSVAMEHAKAVVALVIRELTAVPAVVLARALVELASQAWWLLEPGIGHVGRVSRFQILRYRSAVEGQRAAKADGLPEDGYHLYTETRAQVEDRSRALKIAVPKWSKGDRGYTCGTETLPSATCLIRGMLERIDVPSIYNIYSGYSHGQRFALLREFEQATIGQSVHYEPVVNEESFKGVVAVASYALYPPAERLTSLFGLDQEATNSTP